MSCWHAFFSFFSLTRISSYTHKLIHRNSCSHAHFFFKNKKSAKTHSPTFFYSMRIYFPNARVYLICIPNDKFPRFGFVREEDVESPDLIDSWCMDDEETGDIILWKRDDGALISPLFGRDMFLHHNLLKIVSHWNHAVETVIIYLQPTMNYHFPNPPTKEEMNISQVILLDTEVCSLK